MKKNILLIVLFSFFGGLSSQIKTKIDFLNENSKNFGSCVFSISKPFNFSNYTAYLYGLLKYTKDKNKIFISYDTMFPFRKIKNEIYVHSFITFSGDENNLNIPGIIIGSGSKNIYTAWVLLDSFDYLKDESRIIQIEVGMPVAKLVDKANIKTKVDSVHSGINLPSKYYGKNTIIGIIDAGFDFTHPNFYNNILSNYRIKRAWIQNANVPSSFQPESFNYGAEIKDYKDFLTVKTDNPYESHGSHVAGIAAGNGYGTFGKLTGISSESDILLCSYNLLNTTNDLKPYFSINFGWSTNIADGIQYFNNYSKKVNKPIAINMSLGLNYGPKDGTSSFDRFCDNYKRNGFVLIGAAGNSGSSRTTLNYGFYSFDTSLFTAIRNMNEVNNSFYKGSLDIWGKNNLNIKSKFHYYDNYYWDKLWSSDYIQTKTPKIEFWKLSAKANDTCYFWVVSEINTINNKSHISYFIDNKSVKIDTSYYPFFEISSINNDVKLTTGFSSTYLALSNLDISSKLFKNGENVSSIMEIGGTGKSIISVGSFCAKNSYFSLNSNSSISSGWYINELSKFSSLGPTYDNRMKPDIIAPGELIESSFNSFDKSSYSVNHDITEKVIHSSKDYYYGIMQGTSMAAPMVTGIVALWMEVYPELNVDQVKLILQSTAINDFWTNSYNRNHVGYGKIDAYNGVKFLLSQIPSKPQLSNTRIIQLCSGDSFKLSAPYGYRYLWNDSQTMRERFVKKIGKYSVRVINENNFLSQWSDTVTVVNMPKANIPNISPTTDKNICEDDLLKLRTDSTQFKYFVWSDGTADSSLIIKTSGYYNLKVGNSLNCMSNYSKTIKIVIYPKPSKPTIQYEYPNLMSSQNENNQWYLNGIKIEGAIANRIEPMQTGNYQVEVINQPISCKNISDNYYHQFSKSKENEISKVELYPNPFNSNIKIKVPNGISKIVILDILSREVQKWEFNNPIKNEEELNTSELSSGTYFIQIIDSQNQLGIYKVSKQ